jgi:hypothetical protein
MRIKESGSKNVDQGIRGIVAGGYSVDVMGQRLGFG